MGELNLCGTLRESDRAVGGAKINADDCSGHPEIVSATFFQDNLRRDRASET
jgi:hypothetical protein